MGNSNAVIKEDCIEIPCSCCGGTGKVVIPNEQFKPRVKLSPYGLEMQGKHKCNLVGSIIRKTLAGSRDYTVIVLWDGRKVPESMHESQVEQIK